MRKTALFLVNGNARHGDAPVDEAAEVLRLGGIDPEIVRTRSPEHAIASLQGLGSGHELIVVGGGDGTLNMLLPTLLKMDKAVGVIPLGTANDFARSLEISEDPGDAARVIVDGSTRPVDIASANGRPFLNVVNIGLGEKVARLHKGWTKRLLGFASYPLRWFAVWRKTRLLTVRAAVDGQAPEDFRASQVSVANSSSFGRHFQIDQDNGLHSGRLSVARIDPRSLFSWMKLLPRFLNGNVGKSPDAAVSRARQVRIETRPRAVFSGDGEVMGRTPVDIRVEPSALRVFAPRRE
jgi:YegS/Rv2252/BmrU family lipid kinase